MNVLLRRTRKAFPARNDRKLVMVGWNKNETELIRTAPFVPFNEPRQPHAFEFTATVRATLVDRAASRFMHAFRPAFLVEFFDCDGRAARGAGPALAPSAVLYRLFFEKRQRKAHNAGPSYWTRVVAFLKRSC